MCWNIAGQELNVPFRLLQTGAPGQLTSPTGLKKKGSNNQNSLRTAERSSSYSSANSVETIEN